MSYEDPNKVLAQRPSQWSIPKSPSKRPWVVVIALLLCTLFLHFCLVILVHYGIIGGFTRSVSVLEKKPTIVYELALDEAEPAHFVDTNPYLAEQEAPKTSNYAAKSQVAAQEVASENLPQNITRIDGDLEELTKIVPDQLVPFDDMDPKELADLTPEVAEPMDFPVAELKEQKLDEGPKLSVRPKPKPRQRVKPLVGGMKKSAGGVKNIGVTAVDARFNQFGVYRQKMNEAIGYQWYLLISNYSPTNEDFNTKVYIAYTIDQSGAIINLEVKESTASNLLTLICKDSILSLDSFGPWSEDMIEILGEKQTFYVGFIIR